MPPKFQSSFIPKGPIVSNTGSSSPIHTKEKSFLSFIAVLIFSISLLAALGAFGYKMYLGYSIDNMVAQLEAEKANIDQEAVDEIRRLNNRMLAANELINRHVAMSPLFRFLENSTLRNVSFTEFTYGSEENGKLVLTMRGKARSYSALAQQADLFNKNVNFENPVFSDLLLDEEGNVVFAFKASVAPNFLSYRREIEVTSVQEQEDGSVLPAVNATSTATTTRAETASSSQATTN